MTKSLSLTLALSCVDLSEASRSSNDDAAPLAGSQMIQVNLAAADVTDSNPFSITYNAQPKSCSQDNDNVIIWDAGVDTANKCMKACENWPNGHVDNQNSDRSCGAGYFFQKPDGTKLCRLYENCDTCKGQTHSGKTFQKGEPCKAQCARSDCKGWNVKPKSGYSDILCTSSKCTKDECCDIGSEPAEPEPAEPEPAEPEPAEPEPAGPGSYVCYSNTNCKSAAGYDHDVLRDWVGTLEESKAKCTELGNCTGFVTVPDGDLYGHGGKSYFRGLPRISVETIGDSPGRTCCVPGEPEPYTCQSDTNCDSEGGANHDLKRDWAGTEEECKQKCTQLGCGGFTRLANGKCYFRGKLGAISEAAGRTCCLPGNDAFAAFLELHEASRQPAGTDLLQLMSEDQQATDSSDKHAPANLFPLLYGLPKAFNYCTESPDDEQCIILIDAAKLLKANSEDNEQVSVDYEKHAEIYLQLPLVRLSKAFEYCSATPDDELCISLKDAGSKLFQVESATVDYGKHASPDLQSLLTGVSKGFKYCSETPDDALCFTLEDNFGNLWSS